VPFASLKHSFQSDSYLSPFVRLALKEYNNQAKLLQRLQVQAQMSTIYYEAYCDLVVGFDLTAENLVKGQRVYEKIKENFLSGKGQYLQILTPVEIMANCYGV